MYRHLTAITFILHAGWQSYVQRHLAFVANCLEHFIHSCQRTEDFVNWQKIVGLWTFWMESLKFGYAWEHFGTSKKLFELAMSSCWQIFCKTKKNFVWCKQDLNFIHVSHCYIREQQEKQVFQNYHINLFILASIIST